MAERYITCVSDFVIENVWRTPRCILQLNLQPFEGKSKQPSPFKGQGVNWLRLAILV